ncbi:MAG: Rid family hydrolase, partial [Desulfovibrionales bacterium]|nr:Rid family hydrolase [Desulfovibrionales bacterium]
AILKSSDMSFSDVVKTTILLTDINDFAKVNEVYQSFFEEKYPARVCFEASALPKGANVEIEAIASKS